MGKGDVIDSPQSTQGRAIAAGGAPSDRKRSRATLRTLNDVAEEIARIYRRADRGDIPWSDATKAVFILSSLSKVLAEIEAKKPPRSGLIDANGNAVELPTLADLYGIMAGEANIEADQTQESNS